MEEAPPPAEMRQLLDAASDFAAYPGVQNDDSVKAFLDRYPLPVLFSALENTGVPRLEEAIVACLERVFKTRFGALLIPHYMVSNLLEKTDQNLETAVQLIVEHDVYPLLIDCLINGNELAAAASIDAIKNLAQSPKGINIIFPSNSNDATALKNVAARCSSLARIRILSLVAKLFSLSRSVAAAVYNSNLLNLFEAEISNTSDMLLSLSALELLYELAESPHSTGFLLKTTLLQLLASMISNSTVDPALRTRAVLITGRLLSPSENHTVIDESSVKATLLAIDKRLELLNDQDTDECESALEALGEIGSTIQGAAMLLSGFSPVARHVVASAFNHHGRGKQLNGPAVSGLAAAKTQAMMVIRAFYGSFTRYPSHKVYKIMLFQAPCTSLIFVKVALHALASISGVNRPDGNVLLNNEAEDCLRRLIYDVASNSLKFTPSGLLLSVLQQEPEIRLAAYRLIAALVARPWCLSEVCSKQDIINMVTDPEIETTKNGMEARYLCCTGISKSLSASNKLSDPALSGIVEKLQEAVRRGPYLVAKKHGDAKPIVVTAERF